MSTRPAFHIAVMALCSFVRLMGEEVIVKTNAGLIKGVLHYIDEHNSSRVISGFYNIPYAEPPVEELRFAKPVRKKAFNSVFDATKLTVRCAMSPDYGTVSPLPYSEDCLHLSVIVPGRAPNKGSNTTHYFPVMIYIFGGSWQSGSQDTYISFRLAEDNGVILVTINYRLTFFGFLAKGPNTDLTGNYGLWDQHMAIQWVHDNIAGFGGDSNRVTLFGNSAGAASVIYQAMYPGNYGLVHNVIAQSGSPLAHWGIVKSPHVSFKSFARTLNCEVNSLACLRSKPLKELMSVRSFYGDFLPVVDGDFITDDPVKTLLVNGNTATNKALTTFGSVNLLIGTNSNDGAGVMVDVFTNEFLTFENGFSYHGLRKEFSGALCTLDDLLLDVVMHEYGADKSKTRKELAKIYLDFLMDLAFVPSVVETATAHAQINGSGNTFYYVFDHKPSFSAMPNWYEGASHGDDRAFIFGFSSRLMSQVYARLPDIHGNYVTTEEHMLSRLMMSYWTNFAKAGDPNSATLQRWPRYDVTNQSYIVLRSQQPLPVEQFYRQSKIKLWRRLQPNVVLDGFRCSSAMSHIAIQMLLLLYISCLVALLPL